MPSPVPSLRPVAVGLALLVGLATAGVGDARAQRPPLSFDHIAQDRGLSNGTVTSIVQDGAGFLWLGTEDGLNRYDGRGFTLFRPVPGDSGSMADAWVTSLTLAGDGVLWVGTLRAGVHRYDQRTERFATFRHRPDDAATLSSDEVNAVVERADGQLWVGTAAGVDRLDPATGRVRRYGVTADSTSLAHFVLSLLEDSRGALWVGTRYGLYRARPGSDDPRFERVEGVGFEHPVRTMAEDARGTVWVGTEGELIAFEPESARVVARYRPDGAAGESPFSGRVMTLVSGPDSTLWVGSEGGLAALEPAGRRWVRHAPEPDDPRSLGGHIVRSVAVDRGGVLWVGTESYGLSRHAPSTVRFDLLRHDQSARNTLSNGYVRGITEDRDGDIWIATQFGGVNRVDRETGRITAYRHRPGDSRSLPADNAWAVLQDRRGVVWVGLHRHGLGTLDPRTGAFTPYAGVPSDAAVNVLHEDRAGRLLVGLASVGFIEISADRRRVRRWGHVIGGARGLATDDVQAILEDREGMLWLAGDGGLTRLDRRTGTVKRYRARPGVAGALPAAFVSNVIEDSRGDLWVATKGGGIARLDRRTDRFTPIDTRAGLPHDFAYGMLEDARGRLWVSTDDGIAMVDPVSGAIASFGLEDGLQAREFNRRAWLRARSGAMYFGGINGVNVFEPDRAASPPPPPPVSFVSIRPNGGRPRPLVGFPADSAVALDHGESAFTVSFAALDFTAPAKSRFAYRLEGVDRDWIAAGAGQEASYASVPPGRYLLRVRAANSAGVWNLDGATLAIVVRPPWWGTWWARLAAALVVLGLPFAIVRIRLRAARRRGLRLEQLVEEQTRDLTEAHSQLSAALEREREAARELLDITAAVPGAVFQLRESHDGRRDFPFVSDGVAGLWPDADPDADPDAGADPRRLAARLFARVHPGDAMAVREAFTLSRRSLEPFAAEWRWTTAAGATRWLAVQARPTAHPDGSVVWTGVMSDATTARLAAAEHAALEAKMRQAQKAESLGVLAGGIAHDFNNLLVGVLANADLLRDDVALDADASETLGHIRTSAMRAAELTQQLLAYAGKGRIVVERVELARLVREMMSLLRSAVPRTIAFEFHADPADPAVEGDATQLRQVVMNLVTNASDAIGDAQGHVSVHVGVERRPQRELPLLHHSADMPAEGPYAVISVSDDGCGMDAATLARIFDPFYSTKFTGRGLGLAALLGIVRAHRGGLHVSTSPGQGARFTLYLPLVAVATPAPSLADPDPAAVAPAAGAEATVLVVDDEETVRAAAGRIVRALGYRAITAADGAEALAVMAARDDVRLVLMDVTMPEMDGPTTARTLRERGVDVPIVLMSGYAAEELLARGVMTHATAFLPKPFHVAALAAALDDALAGEAAAVTG